MNISENKRVVALSALFALAFGGIMFYGYGESQKHAANEAEIAQIRDRFDTYANAEIAPTKQGLKEVKGALGEVSAVNKEMQADMNRYAAYCWGDGKAVSALEFQKRLQDACKKVQSLASANQAKVTGSAADLGMRTHQKAAPVADNVPFLDFQLKAVSRVVETILAADVTNVSKVYCEALPEAAFESRDANSRKAKPYFPLGFEVAFEAKRGALPAVINSIVKDKDFFLTITGIAVEGNDKLASVDAYKAPAANEPAGSDLGEETVSESAGEVVAVQKTGAQTETVRVYMTVQVLYFTPGKTK